MAMKRKNLLEVFEHEQFGENWFVKCNEEIWFAAVDTFRAQLMTFISELSIYRLIFMSCKP